MTAVIVVGAGIAGLLTARALSEVVDEVVVLERERLTDSVEPRGHVPQGRHIHLLLSAGLDRLVGWFPGIEEELERRGAAPTDGTRAWVFQGGGYRAQGDWGRRLLSMTRPLLEDVVRGHVTALPTVRLEDGVVVDRVAVSGDRVTGVIVEGTERSADLVVDCSGRSSRLAHQLDSSGLLAPAVSRVTIDCAYTSGFLPRAAGDLDGSFAVCVTAPPEQWRGGAVLPVEGDRWMVTLSGVHGVVPGTSASDTLAFARTLPTPTVAQLIELAGPLTSVASYRFPSSQRRHYERVDRLLPGFVTLGDAACSFNPVYGQGMACAALQAETLARTVRDVDLRSPLLPRAFHRAAATIVDAPWTIAVGGDFQYPETAGPKPRATDQTNRYVMRLIKAAHTSLPLARSFNDVLNLVQPPTSLAHPGVIARVVAASIRQRRHPVTVADPRVARPT
jgi:2-polyprenyl-6-methoxyphenol hydroxylase-like FAD-dependent oxidoreductase